MYKFDCGCEIPLSENGLDIDYKDIVYKLNYGQSCPKVWDLLSEGRAKGVFQLETDFAQTWCGKFQPHSIEEMSALISILRPGTLKNIIDGKSMTQHCVDRKQGAKFEYEFPELEPFLKETWGIWVYQEQALNVCRQLAGFTESQADIMRKSIGKKDAKLLASLEETFVNGCVDTSQFPKENAEEVFHQIEKSNRYSFNKSHGVSYSFIGYLTAWVKVHFPLHFYCAWLSYAKEKLKPEQEIKQLVYDSKLFKINIKTPSPSNVGQDENNITIDKGNVRLGLRSIKRLGDAAITKLVDHLEDAKKRHGEVEEWTWPMFLCLVADNISSTAMNGLICVGFLDFLKLSRKKLLYDYDIFRKLTKREKVLLHQKCHMLKTLNECLNLVLSTPRKDGGVATNKRRETILDLLTLLDSPTSSFKDSPSWVIAQEEDLLGVSLTYNFADTIDTCKGDTTCLEFVNGKTGDMIITAQIEEVKEFKIKNGPNKGQPMGFLKIDDGTAKIDAVVWNSIFVPQRLNLFKGNILTFYGHKGKRNSLSIDKISQIYD